MKKNLLILISFLFIISIKAQNNIALKTSLGIDGYNINYDDTFFSGGKIGVEMAVLKKLTVGGSVGFNQASQNSSVTHFGLDTRYYFGTQVMQGFYSELGVSYNVFKFSNVPSEKVDFIPKNTVSVFLNGGVQKIIKEKIILGFKLGMGVFGPKGSTSPALRLQGAFELGYKF